MALPALLLAAAAAFPIDAGTGGVLVEDHRAAVVTIVVELNVGTWCPWVREHHAADAFRYQLDDPGRSLRKRADALAASIRVVVDEQFMALRTTCLKRDLPAVLDLIRDVLTNKNYDRDKLRRDRRAAEIEWRGRETDVQFRLMQAASRSLFAEGDSRRWKYEKPDPIETDPEKLVAARDALLRFPLRVIGLAGDLTEQEARDAAKDLLPPAEERPTNVAFILAPLLPPKPGVQEVPIRNLTQVYFAYVRDSLPWNDSDRQAFKIANHVLGGHFYSRLYVALRHEAGDTYGAGTREEGDVVPGLYGAATFTRAANASETEAKLRKTMTTFRDEGITEQERADAVSYLRGHRAFGRQSASQILDRYLLEQRLGLAPGTLDAQIDRPMSLPLDEINQFIKSFYDPARFTLLRAVSSSQ